MLEAVSEQEDIDPLAAAAQALFLRGEFRSRQDELRRAAELYLRAAAVGAADRDFAALSIYRAAVMYSTLGRSRRSTRSSNGSKKTSPGPSGSRKHALCARRNQ